jgi:hypothetical protein
MAGVAAGGGALYGCVAAVAGEHSCYRCVAVGAWLSLHAFIVAVERCKLVLCLLLLSRRWAVWLLLLLWRN